VLHLPGLSREVQVNGNGDYCFVLFIQGLFGNSSGLWKLWVAILDLTTAIPTDTQTEVRPNPRMHC
jgi:hypothetical protein